MDAAQQPVAEALYVATSPYNGAEDLFRSKNWKVTNVHNLEELGKHLATLKQQTERKIPLVVLFGHLQELESPPEGINARTLIADIAAAAGQIRGLIPFAPLSGENIDLFNWKVEERKTVGLDKLPIIGFGSEPDKPLRVFAGGKQEGAYSDLAIALGLTTPRSKEAGHR